jgi:zinc protease
MKHTLCALLLAASFHYSLAEMPAKAWPHEGSDLKLDDKAKIGRLPNGLRYLIYPNTEPPGRASLRLYMDVGSLMEEDDQQGMAHFLEHMAFNGTKHFPAGQMVEYFQRLGMSFGGDTNAHTSFRETVYQLELPKIEEKLIDDGIKLFRDYLGRMDLAEAEINRERGIIQSEKLARDSVEWRTMLDGFSFAMPDSKVSKRMPIGTDETLKTMGRPRFVDFYENYYTPSRACVVVVGDVDAAMVEKHILGHFTDAKPARGEQKDPEFGKVSQGRGVIARLHTEMEAGSVDISIEVQHPADNKPDTAAKRREIMVRDMGDLMVNQRLAELAKAEKAFILGGESYSYEFLQHAFICGMMAKCNPENWQSALALCEQELRRALEHGFTTAEFEEAKAGILKMAKLRAEQAATRKSKDLASQLVSTLAAQKVITDPAADLERVTATLATVTKEECLKAYRDTWATKDRVIFIGGKLKLDGDAAAQILKDYESSVAKPVAAPVEEKTEAFAYTDFGPAGKVSKQSVVQDLEITQVVFENNVRLNLKPTAFEKNSVRVIAAFGGGKMEIPADKVGLGAFAQSIFDLGGLEKHSADDLRRILASKTVSSSFSVGSERMGQDAFLLSGKTNPEDLETQLQLLTAYLTAPGYREEAERQVRQSYDQMYQQIEHTDDGIMADKVDSFIHSGDPRFGIAPRAEMEKRSTAEVKAWLAQPLKEGYMEVSIVGDIDVEKTIALVAKTFGALPKRADSKPDYGAARNVKFPADPKDKEFRFKTDIDRALALVYWPTTDMASDIKKTRRLALLGGIMDDRMRVKIREEMGDSYSPGAHHVPSDTFPGYGYVMAYITLKPEQTAKVGAVVRQLSEKLAQGGTITEDEFDRVRKPQLTMLEQMRRDNGYWLGRVLRACQEHPERLDWARDLVKDIEGIKKEDLEALAKEYLGAGKATLVTIVPEK